MKLTFLLCCSLFCCTANAQLYNLVVTLTGHNNSPVPNARVLLELRGINAVPDAHGHYTFKRLPAGEYHLGIIMPGYRPFKKRVTITDHDIVLPVALRPDVLELEEVVVHNASISRRKSQEHLSLEIVKSDFIQKNLGGSLMQTLERLPGVQTIGIGSGQSKPLIRGMGFNRVVVIDKGIKHEGQQWGADHGLEIDQFAVDEVAVLKGAASFAYGSDAIAGAIHIKPPVTPAPGTFGGNIHLTGKTNNALYGGSLNLYGSTRQWFGTARITLLEYADYRVPADRLYVYDYAVPLHRHHLRNTAGNESALHFSTGYTGKQFRSVCYISNTYSKSGFFANAHGLEPRNVNTALHDAGSRDIRMPYQQVNHFKIISSSNFKIAQHRIEALFGYQNNLRREYNHFVTHGYMPAVYPDTLSVSPNLERAFEKDIYSVDIKDQVKFGNHDLAFGISGEVQKNDINGWSFLVPSFDQKSAGAFVYDKMHLNERTSLHGAIRYDYKNIRIRSYADWFPTPVVTNGDTVPVYIVRAGNLQRHFSSLTGSLGINYNLEHIGFKANISKSYRVPIAKELAANGVNYHYFSYEKGNAHLKPEESYQAAIGVLYRKSRWHIQLSPFLDYFPNYIYLNPTAQHDYLYGAGNQVFDYRQSRVIRYGAELQATCQLLKNLSAEVLGEYLYAQQLSGDKKGYTLPFSPPPTLLVSLSFEPLKTGPLRRSYFSVDYRLSAPQNKIVPPEKKTAGYTVMNIKAGTRFNIQDQRVQISLQLQNLFNKRYLLHTSFYRLIGLPEPGRNLILSLKIPFNFLNHKPDI